MLSFSQFLLLVIALWIGYSIPKREHKGVVNSRNNKSTDNNMAATGVRATFTALKEHVQKIYHLNRFVANFFSHKAAFPQCWHGTNK